MVSQLSAMRSQIVEPVDPELDQIVALEKNFHQRIQRARVRILVSFLI